MTLRAAFERLFGEAPRGEGRASGRVNLIGEHIDYQGGMVLPMPIDRTVTVLATPAPGEADVIHSTTYDETVERTVGERSSGHWSDYAFGGLAKARDLGVLEGGVRVAIESDVPYGAGLSSSAAIIVATLRAAFATVGRPFDDVAIARWAQAVENDFIGMPCGIMDQMAVSVAAPGQALGLDTKSLGYDVIDLPTDAHFAVLHSGVTRRLEDGRYAARRGEADAARDALGVEDVCLMTVEEFDRSARLPEPLDRRARHAYTEHRRVLKARDALLAGDMKIFSKMMNESHASMRDDFEMSTPEVDAVVAGSLANGAMGARLTGGGFGGCVVSCVPTEALDAWRAAMAAQFPQTTYVA